MSGPPILYRLDNEWSYKQAKNIKAQATVQCAFFLCPRSSLLFLLNTVCFYEEAHSIKGKSPLDLERLSLYLQKIVGLDCRKLITKNSGPFFLINSDLPIKIQLYACIMCENFKIWFITVYSMRRKSTDQRNE